MLTVCKLSYMDNKKKSGKKQILHEHFPDDLFVLIFFPKKLIGEPIVVPEEDLAKIDQLISEYVDKDEILSKHDVIIKLIAESGNEPPKTADHLRKYMKYLYYYMQLSKTDPQKIKDLWKKIKDGVSRYEALKEKTEAILADVELLLFLNLNEF